MMSPDARDIAIGVKCDTVEASNSVYAALYGEKIHGRYS
jgi:hypothetical protein